MQFEPPAPDQVPQAPIVQEVHGSGAPSTEYSAPPAPPSNPQGGAASIRKEFEDQRRAGMVAARAMDEVADERHAAAMHWNAAQAFNAMDGNHDGVIDRQEFAEAMQRAPSPMQRPQSPMQRPQSPMQRAMSPPRSPPAPGPMDEMRHERAALYDVMEKERAQRHHFLSNVQPVQSHMPNVPMNLPGPPPPSHDYPMLHQTGMPNPFPQGPPVPNPFPQGPPVPRAVSPLPGPPQRGPGTLNTALEDMKRELARARNEMSQRAREDAALKAKAASGRA